jgi:hypothetical protein
MAQLKQEFPGWKFSVTIPSGGWTPSLYIRAMSGPLDLRAPDGTIPNGEDFNWIQTPGWRTVSNRIFDIARVGHYDRSDAMVDHFDTNFYIHLQVGKWDKPYVWNNDPVKKLEALTMKK